MNRDEFVHGSDDRVVCGPGRQVFLVAIESEGEATERNLRQGLWDYFGSLNGGVRKLKFSPCDMIVAEHPNA